MFDLSHIYLRGGLFLKLTHLMIRTHLLNQSIYWRMMRGRGAKNRSKGASCGNPSQDTQANFLSNIYHIACIVQLL